MKALRTHTDCSARRWFALLCPLRGQLIVLFRGRIYKSMTSAGLDSVKPSIVSATQFPHNVMKTKLLSLIPVLLASAKLGVAADTSSEALQKGLFEEEANHNLDAAIKAYQVVIALTDEQRKLAATAVFRLGECYRKLGQTNEAVTQYQRLLRDYSE